MSKQHNMHVKKLPPYSKIVFKVYTAIAIISALLIGFQINIMGRRWFLIPFLVVMPLLVWFIHNKWGKALQRQQTGAVILVWVVFIFHLIPLLLQLVGVGKPRIDTIIVAVMGLLFFYSMVSK